MTGGATTGHAATAPTSRRRWVIRRRCGCCSCRSSGSASRSTAYAGRSRSTSSRSSTAAATGQADANLTYGSYLALVYAGAIFGGYIADKVLGYQRSILIGAVFMSAGLFMIIAARPHDLQARPRDDHRRQRHVQADHLDDRRQAVRAGRRATRQRASRSFTWASMSARWSRRCSLAGWRVGIRHGRAARATRYVFIASGIGMLISLVWFWFGRRSSRASARRSAGWPVRSRRCTSPSARCSRFRSSTSCSPLGATTCSTC